MGYVSWSVREAIKSGWGIAVCAEVDGTLRLRLAGCVLLGKRQLSILPAIRVGCSWQSENGGS